MSSRASSARAVGLRVEVHGTRQSRVNPAAFIVRKQNVRIEA